MHKKSDVTITYPDPQPRPIVDNIKYVIFSALALDCKKDPRKINTARNDIDKGTEFLDNITKNEIQAGTNTNSILLTDVVFKDHVKTHLAISANKTAEKTCAKKIKIS